MNEDIKMLKGIAYDRISKTRLCGFAKEEKIRLADELRLIEMTHTENYFIGIIAKADEEKKHGDFYMPGTFNCSFLLYCAGATTINPTLLNSPFERFINPLTFYAQLLPPFDVCRDKFALAAEPADISIDADISLDEAIFTRAQRIGLIEDCLAEIAKKYPPSQKYQFVREVLEESRGIIVWQEQIIELLRRMGGFSYAEADKLRRDGAKGLWRNAVWYENVRNIFLPHAVACGYSYEFADRYLRYIFEANIYTRLKGHVAAKVLFE